MLLSEQTCPEKTAATIKIDRTNHFLELGAQKNCKNLRALPVNPQDI
jgi:hypothetical protein